jgi:hypothetical protein
LENFDQLLLNIIDHVIEDLFGKMNSNAIYNHLEKAGCPRHEIPRKPEIFSTEMRNVLGHDRGQILGAASILEKAILKVLCTQLKAEFNHASTAPFADYVKNLREAYDNEKSTITQISP